MEVKEQELFYKKLPGAANDLGTVFETLTTALLYLRVTNCASVNEFQLASNVDGAEALDDIVLKVKSSGTAWTTLFFQLKHKENPKAKISLKRATKVKTPLLDSDLKNKLSLAIYFKSYIKIHSAMSCPERLPLFEGSIEDCRFLIYTNADADMSLGKAHCINNDKAVELLGTENSEKIVSFDPNSDEEVYKSVMGFLNTVAEKERICDSDTTSCFVKQLLVCCGQPSPAILVRLIEQELAVCKQVPLGKQINMQFVYDYFTEDMKAWCETKGDGKILTQRSGLVSKACDKVLVSSRSSLDGSSCRLDISFNENALSALRAVLNSPRPGLLHFVSSECSCRLSGTKLLQLLDLDESRLLFINYEFLLTEHRAVFSVWKEDVAKLLVIFMPESETRNSEYHSEIAQKMSGILSAPDGKHKAVVLSRTKNSLTEKLSELLKVRLTILQDTFDFSQISKSQLEKLDAKFRLQGHSGSLSAFLGEDDNEDAKALQWSFLVDVIKSDGVIAVGPALPKSISYFVPRMLLRATVVKFSILGASQLKESITVVYPLQQEIQRILQKCDKEITPTLFEERMKLRESVVQSALNGEIFCSATFELASYVCSYITLQKDHGERVTAFRISSHEDEADQRAWVVFVDDGASSEDMRLLSKFNKSMHMLRLDSDNLQWIESQGSIQVIRAHLDNTEMVQPVPIYLAESEERVTLLCAEPGMGKSTMALFVASYIKEERPESWVIMVSLSNHAKLFHENKHLNAFEFLTAAIKIGPPIQEALFRRALETTGNVCIILDGCDEIVSKYADKLYVLLTSILKTKAQKIWITSRNVMKDNLEDHFHTLAITLCKFNEDNQRSFFQEYWRGKSSLPDKKLEAFITSLIAMMSRAIADPELDWIGVPLQTQMVADVHEHYVTGTTEISPLPEEFNLLQLFEKFVKTKLTICAHEKRKMKEYEIDYEDRLEELEMKLNTDHMQAALVAILSDEDLECLRVPVDGNFLKSVRSGKEMSGIVDDVVDGKPRFVHRVFAEFFTAKWLSINFRSCSPFLERRLYSSDMGIVRAIFDRVLSDDPSLPLHTAVLDQDDERVKTLALQKDIKVNAKDPGGRTPLHLAAASPRPKMTKIVKILTSHEDVCLEAQDTILSGPPMKYADLAGAFGAIDNLLTRGADSTQMKLTRTRMTNSFVRREVMSQDLDGLLGFYLDETGLQVDHSTGVRPYNRLLTQACGEGRERVAELLIKRGAVLDRRPGELWFPFHVACYNGHLQLVEIIFRHCLKLGDYEVTRDLFRRTHKDGRNALGLAEDAGRIDVVRFLLEYGTKDRVGRKRDPRTAPGPARRAARSRTDILQRRQVTMARRRAKAMIDAAKRSDSDDDAANFDFS